MTSAPIVGSTRDPSLSVQSTRVARASISRSTSVSLDILRASAAVTVVLHHANWLNLDFGVLSPFRRGVGHSAVVIFFVLSGFVIAGAVDRSKSATDYVVKRLARIYSVALPALLLTIALDLLTLHLALPISVPSYELRKLWIYLPLHMLFAGDLWRLGISAFSDNPYWSLNYEVWYYFVFGAAVFLRGWVRIVVTGAVFLLMGPKLWLLLPIWLAGAGVYALHKRAVLPRGLARGVAVGAILLFLLFMGLHLDEWVSANTGTLFGFPLRFSQWFLADYVVGLLSMALVWALCSAEFSLPRPLQVAGVQLAKVSFSLYLLHFPLMQFFGALIPGYGPIAVAAAFLVAAGLGTVLEPQRDRLRRLLLAVIKWAGEAVPILRQSRMARSG